MSHHRRQSLKRRRRSEGNELPVNRAMVERAFGKIYKLNHEILHKKPFAERIPADTANEPFHVLGGGVVKIKRFVLYSPVGGVYLGNFLGLGFWSNMDAAGQDAAITFESEAAARTFIKTWKAPPPFPVETRPVVADVNGDYASIEACVSAGLPGWKP